MRITWTDYLRYKAALRGFDLGIIEDIVRYSSERYFDVVTDRRIAIGRCDSKLVSIPYEFGRGQHHTRDCPRHHAATNQYSN